MRQRDGNAPRPGGVGHARGDGVPPPRRSGPEVDLYAHAQGAVRQQHPAGRGRGRELVDPARAHGQAQAGGGGQLGGALPQRGQLGVERLAGAGGRVAVAMSRDALEDYGTPSREAVRRPSGRGDGDLSLGRDAVQRQLPRQHPAECLEGRRPRTLRGMGANHGHSRRDGVVALGLRPDHRLVDPAGAALENLAVTIDEQLIADVVPAKHIAVVVLDRAHDRARLLGLVVVCGDGVMDERELHLAVLRRRARGLRGPHRPRDDRRGGNAWGRDVAACRGGRRFDGHTVGP